MKKARINILTFGSIINSVGEKITDTILFNKKGVTFRNS